MATTTTAASVAQALATRFEVRRDIRSDYHDERALTPEPTALVTQP
jgi:hypothetical protein